MYVCIYICVCVWVSLCLLLCLLACLCDKWTLSWCRTKDKIQLHLTVHTSFWLILATCITLSNLVDIYMWFSTQHITYVWTWNIYCICYNPRATTLLGYNTPTWYRQGQECRQVLTPTIEILIECQTSLRVEFLLNTDSGYPRDGEVTLFALSNPEHFLRFNTHWSAPPVSALARSGGLRKISQSPVSRNSNMERRMDRPRAVVGFIRGVA